jgi:hypothetical protein
LGFAVQTKGFWIEHMEGREQRRRAMALVAVGHVPARPFFIGRAGLGTIERLDLALLINREPKAWAGGWA